MSIEQRLKLDWYNKRIDQNGSIKNFLANKILEHEPNIGHSKHKLMYLNYEDLLELAIAAVNKDLNIMLGEGKDFCDLSDSKFAISQARNNNKRKGQWCNTIRVTGVSYKEGPLRVCAFNTLANKFHFFFIPFEAYRHVSIVEIVIESATAHNFVPEFTGTPNRTRAWWEFEVETFEDMCLAGTTKIPSKKKVNVFDDLFSFHA